MKTIFRSACKSHFVQLPNQMLRDNSISLRARGLLAMVLTHQEEWVITKSWITEQVKEGKQAVASTFRELERSGYAVMHEDRNEVGKILSRTWTFHDSPVPESDRSQATNRTSSSVREGENPHAGNPACGNTACGKPATKNTMGEEDNLREDHFGKVQIPDKQPPVSRKRNPYFDELIRVCGITEEGARVSGSGYAKMARDLQSAGAKVEDIARVAGLHRKTWPTCSVTPFSIVKNWGILIQENEGSRYQTPSSLSLDQI